MIARPLTTLDQFDFSKFFMETLPYIDDFIWHPDCDTDSQKQEYIRDFCQIILSKDTGSSMIIQSDTGHNLAAIFGSIESGTHVITFVLMIPDENGSKSYIYSSEWLTAIKRFQQSTSAVSGAIHFFEESKSLTPSITAYQILDEDLTTVDLSIFKIIIMKLW